MRCYSEELVPFIKLNVYNPMVLQESRCTQQILATIKILPETTFSFQFSLNKSLLSFSPRQLTV